MRTDTRDMMNIVEVVFDVDDVLNNLNEYVFNTLGLREPSRFNMRECTEFSKEQQDSILHMYGQVDTFRNLTYVQGAREICDIEKSGKARVWINSKNFTQEVVEEKLRGLALNIPELSPSRIEMQLGIGDKKKISSFADIVVEDCFTNIVEYPRNTRKILIDKTYNKAETYGTSDEAEGIIRVATLVEANTLIREMVDNWC